MVLPSSGVVPSKDDEVLCISWLQYRSNAEMVLSKANMVLGAILSFDKLINEGNHK